jgi:hypothetical protein
VFRVEKQWETGGVEDHGEVIAKSSVGSGEAQGRMGSVLGRAIHWRLK